MGGRVYGLTPLAKFADGICRSVSTPAVKLRLFFELLPANRGYYDKLAIDFGQRSHITPEFLEL